MLKWLEVYGGGRTLDLPLVPLPLTFVRSTFSFDSTVEGKGSIRDKTKG